jgi:hypothetical protein
VGDKQQSKGVYAAWMQSSGRYVAGQAGSVQAVLIAKGEYKCNPNYPYKVKMAAPPAGVSYPQAIVRGISRGDKRAVMRVPVLPTTAGSKTLRGTFYFSVCTDEVCEIKKQPLAVTIQVDEPAAPAAPASAAGSAATGG